MASAIDATWNHSPLSQLQGCVIRRLPSVASDITLKGHDARQAWRPCQNNRYDPPTLLSHAQGTTLKGLNRQPPAAAVRVVHAANP